MKIQNKKKLSLNKLQLTKVSDLSKIYGGTAQIQLADDGCMFPDNASKPRQQPVKI